jgi:hypothetical protein
LKVSVEDNVILAVAKPASTVEKDWKMLLDYRNHLILNLKQKKTQVRRRNKKS